MNTETRSNMKQIVAAVERTTGDGEVKTWWTRVGVAFQNGDGSWNLRFDFLPTDPRTTIQLRDFNPERAPVRNIRPRQGARGSRAGVRREQPRGT
jgi:hypothetical protein